MKQHDARTIMKRMSIWNWGEVLWNGLEENKKLAINVEQLKKINKKKTYKYFVFSRYTRGGECANCRVFDLSYFTECKLKSCFSFL